MLLIGYQYVSGFVRFSEGEKDEKGQADFSIMSYNVRMFNAYEWTDRKNIPENITAFVREKDPDITLMQTVSREIESDDNSKSELLFALSKAYEDTENYKDSALSLLEANNLKFSSFSRSINSRS